MLPEKLIVTGMLSLLALVGCNSSVRSEPIDTIAKTDSVTVADVRIPSASIGGRLWYRVILPSVSHSERLPVLYLLHGANSNPSEFMQAAPIEKLAAAQRIVVVMPHGQYSYFTNARYKWHARWEDAIATDLVRDVEERWPIMHGREHTGIAGISMGGYGAVKIALKHPGQYRFVATMSGALDITERPASFERIPQTLRIWGIFGVQQKTRIGEDVFHLAEHSGALPSVAWFVSCGEKDSLIAVNQKFVRQLQKKGVILELRTTPGGHEWETWNSVLPEMFQQAHEVLR